MAETLRAERRIRELEQRLATFEALAREADMHRQMAGPGEQEAALSIIDRLAALATPGEDATHG